VSLDTDTLIVANMLNALLLGALAIQFAGRDAKLRWLGQWGVSALVLALGLGGVALRGRVPDFVSIGLANSLCVAALALALRSLRIFRGRPTRDPLAWTLVAVVLATSLLYADPSADFQVRVVAVGGALAVLGLRCARLLGGPVPAGSERSFRYSATVMWLGAVAATLRPLLMLLGWTGGLTEPDVLHPGTYLLYGAFVTVATLGAFWMGIQDLQGELVRSARIDPLTDVLNRGAFLSEFEREVSRSERAGLPFSLAMFDLDHFKRINDEWGHPAGDLALRAVVDTLRETSRRHDVIGRYGGEEFALLMPGTGREIAMRVAERMRDEVERKGFETPRGRVALTVSGGVAVYPADGRTWNALLSAADAALYEAKSRGRNRVVSADARGNRPRVAADAIGPAL